LSDLKDRGLLARDDFERMTGTGAYKDRKTIK